MAVSCKGVHVPKDSILMDQGMRWVMNGAGLILCILMTMSLCKAADMEGTVQQPGPYSAPISSFTIPFTIQPAFLDPDRSTQPLYGSVVSSPVESAPSCRDKVYFLPKLPVRRGQKVEYAEVPLMLFLEPQDTLPSGRKMGKVILKDPDSSQFIAVNLIEVKRADFEHVAQGFSGEERDRFINHLTDSAHLLSIFMTSPHDPSRCVRIDLERHRLVMSE
jgi:hypothetical protein